MVPYGTWKASKKTLLNFKFVDFHEKRKSTDNLRRKLRFFYDENVSFCMVFIKKGAQRRYHKGTIRVP